MTSEKGESEKVGKGEGGKGRRIAFLCVLAFMVFAFEAIGGDLQNRLQIRVFLPDFETDLNKLSYLGYDIAGFSKAGSTAHLVVTREEYKTLASMGYEARILPEPKPFKLSDLASFNEPAARSTLRAPALQDITVDDGYHSFEQVESILRQFQDTFPSIARMVNLGTSHYGRVIWAIKLSDNVDREENEPAIMFNGLHHARELISTEVVLDTLHYLTTRYGTDPDVTRWVDTWEIWLIPVVNPDGNDIVFTRNASWRKNARDNNLNGEIDSDDGVDINRNYPFKWGLTPGSSGVPSSSTYRGPAPASEPEVQAIIELSRKERFVFSISYHSFGGIVLFPYGTMAAINPVPNISRSVCAEFAERCVREDGWSYDLMPRLYDVNGLDRDWHYHNGTIGFVVELGVSSFQPDYDQWRDSIVEGVRPGWQYLLDRINGTSIFGQVEDEQSGLPVEANITIDEIKFSEGEVKTTDPHTGQYYWIVDPGIYNVSFFTTGYIPQSFTVEVKSGEATQLNVALHREDASVSDADAAEDGAKDSKPLVHANISALLQNYPNPFNPGTWIPYILSETVPVTIRIYNTYGDLVRQLHLGSKGPGSYVLHGKAAYWDGRNEAGEQVSSGIYFYSIQAGEFRDTRKMILTK